MKFRTTLILAAIFVVLAACVVYLRSLQVKEPRTTPPEVWSVEEDSIEHIGIFLPRENREVAFAKGAEHRWFFDDPDQSPVDMKRWGGIVLLVTGPQSRRQIADRVEQPADFGLAQPQMIISLGLKDYKEKVRVLVGDRTPDNNHFYVQVEGTEPLYIVDHTWGEVMKRLATEPPLPAIIKERRERSLGQED